MLLLLLLLLLVLLVLLVLVLCLAVGWLRSRVGSSSFAVGHGSTAASADAAVQPRPAVALSGPVRPLRLAAADVAAPRRQNAPARRSR